MVTFTIHDPSGHPVTPPFFGIADSGADSSLFPMAVMDDLGIAKGDCDKQVQTGAGGQCDMYCWKGGTLPADFWGTMVDLVVNFSDTPFILLGRSDFFAAFKVSFDQRSLRFAVESY